MSSHIVEVVSFTLEPLPNSDFLSIAHVKGWQCVVRTSDFEGVDKAIYIPIDSIVPDAPEFAFLENYNQPEAELRAKVQTANWDELPKDEQRSIIREETAIIIRDKCAAEGALYVRPKYRRVKTKKLRSFISQGILLPTLDPAWPLGMNVAEVMGITKYEPPVHNPNVFGGAGSPFLMDNDPNFHKYTDLENIKHFPDILAEGEEVIFSEKLHGTNFRIGMLDGKPVVGSHKKTHLKYIHIPTPLFGSKESRIGRVMMALRLVRKKKVQNPFVYWKIAAALDADIGIFDRIRAIADTYGAKCVIVHGEIFGESVQDLTYELKEQDLRVFDISVNGTYMNWDEMCDNARCVLGLKPVPVLARGPFSMEALKAHTEGKSSIAPSQIKEGCVVRPVKERWHPRLGRVILKSISDAYLLRKDGTENH